MSTTPLVSIVIPCFNQARYLSGALSSVHAQDWPHVESIVVDDGSTDDTSDLATSLGATIVERQPNQGLSQARNAGLRLAHGQFVIFLDADDELMPSAVSQGVAAFSRHPHARAVAGRCSLIDTDGRPLPTTHPTRQTNDLYADLLQINFVWTPGAAIFRTDTMRDVGGFPADYPAAADYAVVLSFARRGWLALEPRDVVRYRKHESNMSSDPMLMLGATLSVLAREQPYLEARHREALLAGRRRWRTFYGEQLTMELRREWRGARRLARLARGAAFLCRHCPREAATHFWRKLSRVLRQLPPSEIDPTAVRR